MACTHGHPVVHIDLDKCKAEFVLVIKAFQFTNSILKEEQIV